MQLHTLFTPPIITGSSISESLPTHKRGVLFVSLSKALNATVKGEVGWNCIDNSDGLAMFNRIDLELGLKRDSTLNNLNLLTALNHTKKVNTKRLNDYHLRFTQALAECKENKVMPFDKSWIHLLYLRNLQESSLDNAILTINDGSDKKWSVVDTLDELQKKVKSHLLAVSTLTTSSSSDRRKTTTTDRHQTSTTTDEAKKTATPKYGTRVSDVSYPASREATSRKSRRTSTPWFN